VASPFFQLVSLLFNATTFTIRFLGILGDPVHQPPADAPVVDIAGAAPPSLPPLPFLVSSGLFLNKTVDIPRPQHPSWSSAHHVHSTVGVR
jgi:hypothetical protein